MCPEPLHLPIACRNSSTLHLQPEEGLFCTDRERTTSPRHLRTLSYTWRTQRGPVPRTATVVGKTGSPRLRYTCVGIGPSRTRFSRTGSLPVRACLLATVSGDQEGGVSFPVGNGSLLISRMCLSWIFSRRSQRAVLA